MESIRANGRHTGRETRVSDRNRWRVNYPKWLAADASPLSPLVWIQLISLLKLLLVPSTEYQSPKLDRNRMGFEKSSMTQNAFNNSNEWIKDNSPALICCQLCSSIPNWPPTVVLVCYSIALDRIEIVNSSSDCTPHLWRTLELVQMIETLPYRLYSFRAQCRRTRVRMHHIQTVTPDPVFVLKSTPLLDCCTSCPVPVKGHNRRWCCALLQRLLNLQMAICNQLIDRHRQQHTKWSVSFKLTG